MGLCGCTPGLRRFPESFPFYIYENFGNIQDFLFWTVVFLFLFGIIKKQMGNLPLFE